MKITNSGQYQCPVCFGKGFKSYSGGPHNEDGVSDREILRMYGELISVPVSKMQMRAYSSRIAVLVAKITKGAKAPRRFKPQVTDGAITHDVRLNNEFRGRQLSRHKS